jgi:hypothetical protein
LGGIVLRHAVLAGHIRYWGYGHILPNWGY